jgi:hypothetical protein
MLDQMSDPDYFYHVSLSKQIMTSGFPETVPQAKDIGWGVQFIDKEYLYHVITTFFYTYFGEPGIRASSLIFLAISSCTLLLHSLKALGARLFLFPLLLIALDPHFIRRMIMVRPHTLAVLLFVFIVLGFVSNKKYMILIASFLFALSYHGLQIPGILIAASLFTAFVSQPGYLKLAGFCALGLIIGSLVHPYFPGNLSFLAQITNIIRDTSGVPSLPYGGEIYPWKTSEFLNYSLILGIVFALAMSTIGNMSESQREDDKKDFSLLMFLTVAFSLYLCVSFLTPRGREYLIPTAVFLAIQVLRHTPITGTVLVTIVACTQLFILKDRFDFRSPKEAKGRDELYAALDKIPADEKAHMVNCNWSVSPYIMYRRPNLTFTDLLDPSFLFLANKTLHEARADMVFGRMPDYRFIVNDVFKAKYILCDDLLNNLSLDSDPHFERIHPLKNIAKTKETYGIFRVKEPTLLPQFQTEFEYSLPDARDNWKPITAEFKTATGSLPTSHMNFLSLLSKEELTEKSDDDKERIANCLFVRPKDLTKHIGTNFIGLGGGPNIRLWVNDTPVYENDGEPERQKSVALLVPLEKPLKVSDKIEAMICPGVVQSYFSFTLSFWTEAYLTKMCSERIPPANETDPTTVWKFKGINAKNCLGPFATGVPKVDTAAFTPKLKK